MPIRTTLIPKRRYLGQHFLKSQEVAAKMVESAGITPEDIVLEIGVGSGALTKRIGLRAAKVFGYEIDPILFWKAKTWLKDFKNIELLLADPLDLERSVLPRFSICITSLPYSRSLDFVEWLSTMTMDSENEGLNCRGAVALLQNDFAKKLLSPPGGREYRAVTVIAQLSFRIERIALVKPSAFLPPPKVLSAILKFTSKKDTSSENAASSSSPLFFPFNSERVKLLKRIFSFRSRLLRTALKLMSASDQALQDIGSEIASKRVEDLELWEFSKLIPLLEKGAK